jgi:hypothetical protein
MRVAELRRRVYVMVDAEGTAVLVSGRETKQLAEVRRHPRLMRLVLERLGVWLRTSAGRWPADHPIVRAVRWAVDLVTDWIAWHLATQKG